MFTYDCNSCCCDLIGIDSSPFLPTRSLRISSRYLFSIAGFPLSPDYPPSKFICSLKILGTLAFSTHFSCGSCGCAFLNQLSSSPIPGTNLVSELPTIKQPQPNYISSHLPSMFGNDQQKIVSLYESTLWTRSSRCGL